MADDGERGGDRREILLITKGHPFEREPFCAIFDEMQGVGI